jgi:fructuronate reductase
VTEPFSQWVIEDRFAGPRPRWDAVGAELVADVAPYETGQAAHAERRAFAAGLCAASRAGTTFVHEAVADPELRALALQLMREEAAPTIAAAPGQDLEGLCRGVDRAL